VFSAYLEMCYQVALGLEHMHAKGVVHLDLKESNILLGQDGRVVLADSGICEKAQDCSLPGALLATLPRISCKRVAKGAQEQGTVHGPQWTCTAQARCFLPS
jgi:serine/threonine protein kinase